MSLRNKYTKEEFDELEELILNSRKKEEFDYKHIKFAITSEKSYDGIEKKWYELDEIGQFGKKFGLWNFEPLKNTGHKHNYPEINQDIKDAFSKYIKSETEIKERWSNAFDPLQKEIKYACIINHMVKNILEKKANGIISQVAIMSIDDYDSFIEYVSKFQNEFNTTGIIIAGVKLLVHPSINAKDGEIEIY